MHDKPLYIAKNSKYDEYQHGLASVVYKFLGKKTAGGTVKKEDMSNRQLAEELYKLIIRKFEKRKVHSSFTDSTWGADITGMQLIKDLEFYHRLLMFSVNRHGLSL